MTGRSWIEDDLLCTQAANILTGHRYCYPLFRNRNGTAADFDEYVMINPFGRYSKFRPGTFQGCTRKKATATLPD